MVNKHIRRRISLMLCIVMLAVITAACGGNTSPAAESSPPASESAQPAASGSQDTANEDNEVEPLEFRFAHYYPVEEPVAKGVQKFADLVAEKSSGKITVKVFPSGQLYTDMQIPDALSTGQIEMGLNTMEIWASRVAAAEFSVLPLFTNYDQLHWALDNGLHDVFTEEFNKLGVQPVIWADYGFSYFASKGSPLKTADDFKGRKVRTTSPTVGKIVQMAGGTPITMPGQEVVQALQRGTIDAAMSGITAFVALQYYQFTEYYSGPQNIGLVSGSANLKWWNSLSDAQRAILLEAAREAQEWISAEVGKQNQEGIKTLEANGMTMVELDRDTFKEINDWVISEYIVRSGDAGKKVVEIAEKAVQAVGG
jgi:TRAP-type C4-dicarboxylate transport system substrate-binding protein